MVNKFAGFFKRMKKLGSTIGSGMSWINDNIIKPMKPLIQNGLEAAGYKDAGKYIDMGSNIVDKFNKQDYSGASSGINDMIMETQRLPKGYSNQMSAPLDRRIEFENRKPKGSKEGYRKLF